MKIKIFFLYVFTLILISGCENPNNPSINDDQEEIAAVRSWRIIAANNAQVGIAESNLLYRFGYSQDGALGRLWHYDIQTSEYSADLLNDEKIYNKNIGGGIFFTLGGHLTIEHWSLGAGWTASQLVDNPEGDIISAEVKTQFYHPYFGGFVGQAYTRGLWGDQFDDIDLPEDLNSLELWRNVDIRLADIHTDAVMAYTLSFDAEHIKAWLEHYSDFSYDESSRVASIKLYRCSPPQYGIIYQENEDNDFSVSVESAYPINELAETPCHAIKMEYSNRGLLESVTDNEPHPTGLDSPNLSSIEYVFSYQLQGSYLIVEANKWVTYMGIVDEEKSSTLWAAYENTACNENMLKFERDAIPRPFQYCIDY